jgi:hypothetical protein
MIPEIKVEYENGYLGEIMVYTPTGEVGLVEGVVESQTGWTTEIALNLKDGSERKGQPSDFEDAGGERRSRFFGDTA